MEELNVWLTGDRSSQSYAAFCNKLGMSEGAVKAAGHRLRQRYRGLLREEIASTVASLVDVDEELRCLFSVRVG